MSDDRLDDFTAEDATHLGVTRRVYRKGSGPAVIVIAEMPGITPAVADFARRVADLGATAVMPSLFGTDGKDVYGGNPVGAAVSTVTTMARACISREFSILALGRSSPVTRWLRALAADEHERCGGPGVGAVGMCFTGGFALAMAADDRLLAPVLAQPSLPFAVTGKHRRSIDIGADDLAAVQARCAKGLQVMGLRFEGDLMSPAPRFRKLEELLGDAFIGIELPDATASPDSPLPKPHSTLTVDLVDEPGQPTRVALDQVLDFLRRRLEITAPPT
ncbi:dienelactone hydrolase family protein [Gordonia sp. NB41Y]|uniref:dienelactone hydrolase family protein n=1 Tax=Gordonia sp. NB41Y TaxID=875808 RepID=UPI0006B16D17|nr:dienelactone hydrolase family protein [Gordonia sp. NB41Y]KOY49282.1 dienelactone hydrolase [Gordonia sp. NB41Y]WLP91485.1 dienelactone hydrolase family protein [Gordonia sp. NB41Y]